MISYNIIQPRNELELGEMLRANPLTDAVLRLIVLRGEGDDLSARRGDPVGQEELAFNVGLMALGRPTFINGTVQFGEELRPARIDATGTDSEDENNGLSLTVLTDD